VAAPFAAVQSDARGGTPWQPILQWYHATHGAATEYRSYK